MTRSLLAVACLLAACAHTQRVDPLVPPPTPTPPAPRASFMKSGPDWLRADVPAPSLQGRHVVFVAGYLSELIPGYFIDNAYVSRELGAETSMLFPPSSGSLDDDLKLIDDEITLRRNTPLLLVGHSKGGAGVLLTVLKHPELILDGKVEAVVVVQGCIKGSPLADNLTRVGLLNRPGMASLTSANAKQRFDDALDGVNRLTPEQQEKLFSHIFYVRSAHDQTSVAAELSLTELLLRTGGPNDGMVPTSQMMLERGVDLGVLDSDHASLTVSSFLAVSTQEERRAFTKALYGEVGRQLHWSERTRLSAK